MRPRVLTPAYWEGQVRVTGTRRGDRISGVGFVEQYYGSQNQVWNKRHL